MTASETFNFAEVKQFKAGNQHPISYIIEEFFNKNSNIVAETTDFNEILNRLKTFALVSFIGDITSDDIIQLIRRRYLSEIRKSIRNKDVT